MIKKTIAILLAVLFLVSLTAGAVSADKDYKPKTPTTNILNFKPILKSGNVLKNDKGSGLKSPSMPNDCPIVLSWSPYSQK
jgi:hypothetical protein